MEAKLNADTINYLRKNLDTSFTHEETEETIVPDSMPDVDRILDTDGVVTIRSKEADNGRISLSGTIAVTVIYLSLESGGIHKLEMDIPFTTGVDAAGVSDESRLTAVAKIGNIDARTINSRKIIIRTDLIIEVRAFEDSEFIFFTEIEEDEDCQVLSGSSNATLITQVQEKSFSLADEFPMPAGKPRMGQILKTRVALESEDVKTVGNKLIFKGAAIIHVLYRSDSDELTSVDFSASFSQIMEMAEEDEDQDVEIKFMLTNFYVEQGSGAEEAMIAVEINAVAQAVAKKRRELAYISDIYSTAYEINDTRETIAVDSEEKAFTVTASMRETIESSEQASKIIDTSVTVGKAHFSEEGDGISLKTNAAVSVIYMTEDGKLGGLSKKIEVSTTADYSSNMISGVSAAAGDIQVAALGSGIDVSVPVHFEVRSNNKLKISAVTGVEWDEESPRDLSALPSVVVHHAKEGESLWNMAKNFASTESLIMMANNLEEDAVIQPGQFFIVPKRR